MEFLIQEDQDFWCVEAQEAKEGLLNLNFVSDKDGIFDTNPYTFIRVLWAPYVYKIFWSM